MQHPSTFTPDPKSAAFAAFFEVIAAFGAPRVGVRVAGRARVLQRGLLIRNERCGQFGGCNVEGHRYPGSFSVPKGRLLPEFEIVHR